MPTPIPKQGIKASQPIPSKIPVRFSISLIVSIVVAVIIIVFGFLIIRIRSNNASSGLSAIYLTSGDILVGKLSFSPEPTLTNVWIIEHGTYDNNSTQMNLIPFKNTPLSPDDEVHINPQQILFWTTISSSSELFEK